MLDQMSMPVLFVIVFVLLGLFTVSLFVGIRILGARQRSSRARAPQESPRTERP